MRNIGCLWRGDLSPLALGRDPANGMGVKISSGMVHLARERPEKGVWARDPEGGQTPPPLRPLRRRVHVLAPLRRMRRTRGPRMRAFISRCAQINFTPIILFLPLLSVLLLPFPVAPVGVYYNYSNNLGLRVVYI